MGKKILVIDNNQDISAALAFKLRSHGYEVLTADGGKEGLEVARKEAPHLILLDFMMPGMDGSETALLLKLDDKTKNIPVIFLTSLIEEKDTISNNFVDYMAIPKSIRFADLFRTIDEVLDKGAL